MPVHSARLGRIQSFGLRLGLLGEARLTGGLGTFAAVEFRLSPAGEIYGPSVSPKLPRALREMKDRDPEDAHALALARTLRLPLWSNDRDLENTGVPVYTTAGLLRALAGQAMP